MSPQIPSVGRVVHYRSYGTPGGEFTPECRAAIITEVHTLLDVDPKFAPPETLEGLPRDPVGLCVLNPTGVFFHDAEHDENEKRGGTWHWPERVGPPPTLDQLGKTILEVTPVLENVTDELLDQLAEQMERRAAARRIPSEVAPPPGAEDQALLQRLAAIGMTGEDAATAIDHYRAGGELTRGQVAELGVMDDAARLAALTRDYGVDGARVAEVEFRHAQSNLEG